MAPTSPSNETALTDNHGGLEGARQKSPAPAQAKEQSQPTLPSFQDKFGETVRESVRQAVKAERQILPTPPKPPVLFVPGKSQLRLWGLPIKTYRIGKNYFNMQAPPQETTNQTTRRTADNREITYTLKVVQQPDKARACGSGTKSSNDRRPVDPPPVVELKTYIDQVDCTSSYDATFMLYASLEPARPIANGKIHVPTQHPVLAGVTVASAAYLEKPNRAAYFIFPDLSVRHEGWYRLRFSLFEGIKHEADADMGKPFDHAGREGDNLNASIRHAGVFNRMDVLSTPFQVFSAKKFPGLEPSTELSVLVSDQGCRVRIRRDVRQRKKRTKDGEEGDNASSSYHGTPQANYQSVDHSRSASRNSLGSQYDRKDSVGGVYARQMSITSLPMTSPLLPTPTSSMPPPSAYPHSSIHRPFIDQLPRPTLPLASPYYEQSPASMASLPQAEDTEARFILPPLQTSSNGGPRQALYQLPPTAATKRSYSPTSYGQQASLKQGARPGASATYTAPNPPSGEDIIEPDLEADDEDDFDDDDEAKRMSLHGRAYYRRADNTLREVGGYSTYQRTDYARYPNPRP